MNITYKTARELLSHEGIVREAYKDSKGILTWSAGITDASGHLVGRYIGKPQSLPKCLSIYLWVLEKYAKDVRKAFKGFSLTEAQFAAALSFHYNTGGIFEADWVREWKLGSIEASRESFMNWRKPPSIIPRRQAERDLFFNDKWSGKDIAIEYTRVDPKTLKPKNPKRVNIRGALLTALSSKRVISKPKTRRNRSKFSWVEFLVTIGRILLKIFSKGGRNSG